MNSRVTASFTFAQIPDMVLFSGVSDRAIRLFAVLHKYSTMPLGAIPSQKTLAEQMGGCSIDKLHDAQGDLVRAGFLQVVPRWRIGTEIYEGDRPKGSEPTSNLYVLLPNTDPPTSGSGNRPEADQVVGSQADQSEIDPREKNPILSVREGVRRHLHDLVRRRIFGGMNAPDTDWCVDLIRRGATVSDCEAAVDAAVNKNPSKPAGMPYVRVVLESRVEEREAGRDPDRSAAGGARTARGGNLAGANRRGGMAAGGAGRDRVSRVEGFDTTGFHPVETDADIERLFPSTAPRAGVHMPEM